MKPLILFLSLFLVYRSYGQTAYACFENDKNNKLRIQVSFNDKERAQYVKYEGQGDSIKLIYSNIKKFKNTGGIPAVYWAETYLEKYQGKITGEYTFTNAGTYQLDVTYTRKRDNKEFYFRVIESTVDRLYGAMKPTPCF